MIHRQIINKINVDKKLSEEIRGKFAISGYIIEERGLDQTLLISKTNGLGMEGRLTTDGLRKYVGVVTNVVHSSEHRQLYRFVILLTVT